jgi:hypothetical protein
MHKITRNFAQIENDLDLSVDDLEISDVKFDALTVEYAKGLPEMGATLGSPFCCSCCIVVQNEASVG